MGKKAQGNKDQTSMSKAVARARSVSAGVTIVGHSSTHGTAAVLLGGRFYTRRQVYEYTDFGGGADGGERGKPHLAAFRECVEELFDLSEEDAKVAAASLWEVAQHHLVGGAPLLYARNNYTMFIVPAEVLLEPLRSILQVSFDASTCAVEALMAHARRNSELSSLALIGIDEFLAAGTSDGVARPLSVRSLDGQKRCADKIHLRKVMVGRGSSVAVMWHALSSFSWSSGKSSQTQTSSADSATTTAITKGSTTGTSNLTLAQKESLKLQKTLREIAKLKELRDGSDIPLEKNQLNKIAREEELRSRLAELRLSEERPAEAADGEGDHRAPPAQDPSGPYAGSTEAYKVGDPKAKRQAGDHGAATFGKAHSVGTRAQHQGREKQPFVFDMETGDPDDVLTLLFLASHPQVDLRAVTLTPGSEEQVSLVRWILQDLDITGVRLGAKDWPANRKEAGNMKGHFYGSFGRAARGEPVCERADHVLLECCDDTVTLLTGAPLHNLGVVLKHEGFRLGRWVAQGGFAGEGVVPRRLQMDKFFGKAMCRTWNFGNSISAAKAALATPNIRHRVLVSKNVCHRVVYDAEWHACLRQAARGAAAGMRSRALNLMFTAMDSYRNRDGKKLHDPLALAVALDETVCELAEVRVFNRGDEWGSSLSPGSGIWISVDYDAAKFRSVLLGR